MLARRLSAFLGFFVTALFLVLLWSFLGSRCYPHREGSLPASRAFLELLDEEGNHGPFQMWLYDSNDNQIEIWSTASPVRI